MSNVFDFIVSKALHKNARIVLTESEDTRVIEACQRAAEMDLCHIILMGNERELSAKFTSAALKNMEFVSIGSDPERDKKYIEMLYALRKGKGMTEGQAQEQVKNRLVYANLMLVSNDADGIVSGAITHTADVLRPAFQITKMKEGVSKASSVFIMESPSDKFGENGFLVFADCGVNPNPSAEDLAEIAALSSETAKTLCAVHPRVALLSYSTKSGDEMTDENVVKVKKALEIIKKNYPKLEVDGELQADAALVPEVAKLKSPKSKVAGRANVLIFPDLNAGNIAYKLVSRLAGVRAVGPILQGLKKPVNDLSRGATVDEIVLAMAITSIQSKEK